MRCEGCRQFKQEIKKCLFRLCADAETSASIEHGYAFAYEALSNAYAGLARKLGKVGKGDEGIIFTRQNYPEVSGLKLAAQYAVTIAGLGGAGYAFSKLFLS